MTASLPLEPLLSERLSGSPLLVLLDVDGTLAPIAPRPDDVVVPAETQQVLSSLAARPGVHVAIVSGRAAADAKRLVPLDDVWIVGNHGLETLAPGGPITVDAQVEPFRERMGIVARLLEHDLRDVTGVIIEDKVWSLSVHYRLAADDAIPRVRAAVEGLVLKHGLKLTEGKRVLEVRAPIHVDKGTAVMALSERLRALDEGASLLFAGDDVTDEDAFSLLRARAPRAVTIRVSGDESRPTAAEFTIRDPAAMRELLLWLDSLRG